MTGPPDSGDLVSGDEWVCLAESLGLSERLAEVLERAFSGMTEREIALDLGIAQNTVHDYVKRLYRKLEVHSRNELLMLVFSEVTRIRAAG